MTKEELETLRELALEATRGPWETTESDRGFTTQHGVRCQLYTLPICSTGYDDGSYRRAVHDSAYIAAASPDVVLELLDLIDNWAPKFDAHTCKFDTCGWPCYPHSTYCLGHLLQMSEEEGIKVPEEERAKWARIINKIGFHTMINAPGQPFAREDYDSI